MASDLQRAFCAWVSGASTREPYVTDRQRGAFDRSRTAAMLSADPPRLPSRRQVSEAWSNVSGCSIARPPIASVVVTGDGGGPGRQRPPAPAGDQRQQLDATDQAIHAVAQPHPRRGDRQQPRPAGMLTARFARRRLLLSRGP